MMIPMKARTISLAVACMVLLPLAAHAASITILPQNFLPAGELKSGIYIYHNPAGIGQGTMADADGKFYWASVKVPVGKTITKVSFLDGGPAYGATLQLLRSSYGDTKLLAYGSFAGPGDPGGTVVLTPTGESMVVVSGKTYWVQGFIRGGARILGVKVYYQ